MTDFSTQTILVTGANSGMGFEAAAQLSEAGYGHVILACRTLAKAEGARKALVERTGRDPFEVLVVDVSSIASATAAADELGERGLKLDALLLNAGMVSGAAMRKSEDGIEEAFAASLIGHHVMAVRLLEAGVISDGGRIVIAGSEGANNDLPAMMDMKAYDFATGGPKLFGDDLHEAMFNFARGNRPESFNPFRHYAGTKLFVAWWAAAMQRRYGDRVSIFAVSPGSTLTTNAGRHLEGFKKFMFLKIMPMIGPFLGMHQEVGIGAKRYVDVLLDTEGKFEGGRTYTSRPKKLVGPLQVVDYPHVMDELRQETAWGLLGELTGTLGAEPRVRASA